ncbi:MAG: cyclic nucleotide-binding domain-containing protein [Sandaracinaceae bacterium]|nr:cyclic nucleotide-binding domain-containing protein [Sandaracinaceae bacterium]
MNDPSVIPPGGRALEDAEREALLVDLEQVLDASHLFKSLGPDGRRALVHAGYVVFLEPGESLMTQGDEGSTMYLVLDGKVRVETSSAAGTVQLAELGRGACLGEVSVLTGSPRTATMTALAATQCMTFEKHRIVRLADAYPRVRQLLEAMIAGRARDTLEKILGS